MTEQKIKEKNLLFTIIPILLKSIKNKQLCERGEFFILLLLFASQQRMNPFSAMDNGQWTMMK